MLVSVDRNFDAARPVGADLRAAFADLLDRAWSSSAPAHPRFEPADLEVSGKELSTTLAYVERALGDPDGRVLLETADRRSVSRVANALGVGRAGETHFLFGDDQLRPWAAEFERGQARDGTDPSAPVTVGQVRGWMRAVRPAYGLRPEVEDLVVLAWAALRKRGLYPPGSAAPRPGQLPDAAELRPEPLPTAEDFRLATLRAQSLFGIVVPPHLTAGSLARFCELVQQDAGGLGAAPAELVGALETAYARAGVAGDRGRLTTARSSADLLESLRTTRDRVALVRLLAHAALPVTEAALARSARSSSAVTAAVVRMKWERLRPLVEAADVDDARGRDALRILGTLREALAAEELVTPLPAALAATDDEVFRWLSPPAPAPTPPPTTTPNARTGRLRRAAGSGSEAVLAELGHELSAHPDATYEITWTRSR